MKFSSFVFLLSILVFSSSCEHDKLETETNQTITDSRLEFISKHKLIVPEPSGLTISLDGKFLWTVSDETSTLYKISFNGECLDSIKLDGIDMEGVTNFGANEFCIITERDRGLLFLDSTKTVKKRILLDLNGNLNMGIEGVTYSPKNKHLYILNEKKPTLLLELDENYSIINKHILDYATDFSGLNYDEGHDLLWMISDENKSIFKTDLTGKLLDTFKLDIPQIEGIAIDFQTNLIYIVSDITECLYVFKINSETGAIN